MTTAALPPAYPAGAAIRALRRWDTTKRDTRGETEHAAGLFFAHLRRSDALSRWLCARMALPDRKPPSPYLLEACYWRARLARMETVQRGLLILPRADLSSPLVEVVEWRLRAHDGLRLWGLRGSSPFHPQASSALVREVPTAELPEIDIEAIAGGCLDFVFPVPAGRRLEDRVLDLLRVYQVAVHAGVDPARIELVPTASSEHADEFLIASGLVKQGLVNHSAN